MLSTFLAFESKILISKPSKIIYPGILYLTILAILPFTISNEILANKAITVAFFTISILFVIQINFNKIFEEDYKDGFLEQIIMSGFSLPSFIFAKLIFNTFLVFSSIITTFPILVLFFSFPKEIIFTFSFLSLMLCFSLILMSTLTSSFTTGLQNNLVATLIISSPLSLSMLIDFSLVCNELVTLGYINDKSWLVWVMLGKIICLLPVVLYLTTITLRDCVNNFK